MLGAEKRAAKKEVRKRSASSLERDAVRRVGSCGVRTTRRGENRVEKSVEGYPNDESALWHSVVGGVKRGGENKRGKDFIKRSRNTDAKGPSKMVRKPGPINFKGDHNKKVKATPETS